MDPALVRRPLADEVARGDCLERVEPREDPLDRRQEDVRDRRSKLLTLTAKGRRTFERFAALRFAGLKRFVAGMSDEEREALAAGLRPLAKRLSP